MSWYPIETERLLIRPYRETDYDDLLKIQSREDVTRFLLYGPKTPAEVRESLRLRMTLPALDTDGQAVTLAVELRATGQLLGDVTLFMVSTEHSGGEIGFVFHPDFHGQGYAGEAARAVLAAGFGQLRLHRIVGRCDARNTASAALLERLGMRQEAHFVRNEFLQGEWTDELVYALLAEEWQASNQNSSRHADI